MGALFGKCMSSCLVTCNDWELKRYNHFPLRLTDVRPACAPLILEIIQAPKNQSNKKRGICIDMY